MQSAAIERTMFPGQPGGGQKRSGERKERQYAFRPTRELEDFVEGKVEAGYKITAVLLQLSTVGKDVAEEMGADWFEVERLAAVEGIPAGRMLARLAKDALKRRSGSRK